MKRVLVTGGNGLVGNALYRKCLDQRWHNASIEFIYVTRSDGDLTKEEDVKRIFEKFQPHYVIHTAAKVGGIGGNMAGHADYFYQNSLINSLMIHYSHLHKVEKLLAFSSVCVFPDDVVMLREDIMHNGPPFAGNFAYAYAKRMVDVQIRAYKDQYGHSNWCSIIPGNIYGINDYYNVQQGHVIPSLCHKILNAKKDHTDLKIWGDGKSLREFLFADDLAEILIRLLNSNSIPERLIVSGYEQHSIRDMVSILTQAADFKGEVIYETEKPNGQRNRQSNLALLKSTFPDFVPTPLEIGLGIAYNWFEKNYPNVRL